MARKLIHPLEWYDEQVENVRIIMDPVEARSLIRELSELNEPVALDFETTGLDPKYSRVRLSCIYHPSCGAVILDHMYCDSFKAMAEQMSSVFWLVYNAKFEVRWFDYVLPATVELMDVDFLFKAKRGGGHSSLLLLCKRHLGLDLDKGEQRSDWTVDRLTASQINYAALDGVVTYALYEQAVSETTQKQRDAAWHMQTAVRPTVECEETGMVLDVPVHEENIKRWKLKQSIAIRRVRHFTSTRDLPNWGSDKQVSDLLKKQLPKEVIASWPKTEKTGQLSTSSKVLRPIAAKSSYPFSRWLNALIQARYYKKYLTTYGETLVTKQYLEDKITYRLNIAAAATGRYSSSSINIQNIPRAPYIRRAFLPPYGYTHFVVADYSGIEVRVLAELSQDKLLLRDVIYGNVHASSAATLYHIAEQEFIDVIDAGKSNPLYPAYSEMRSKAKGFTFQLTYGAAAAALSLVLKCSVGEAEEKIKQWAKRYEKAYNYRYVMFDKMSSHGYLPVVDGRTIFVSKNDRTLPVASNYGIQGAAATVMMAGMNQVYNLRNARSKKRDIIMCATVHDELILGVRNEGYIPVAESILEDGMKQGWLDVFPDTSTDNLVEAKSGTNWSAK